MLRNDLQEPVLRRSLSLTYTYQGEQTADDPASYEGEERRLREDAVLRDLPDTGYAEGIREERAKALLQENHSAFFKQVEKADQNVSDVLTVAKEYKK